MNAVSGIFVALALMFGGGYAMNKIYVTVKQAAVDRIQRGMPPLSKFTNQMTCSRISKDGDLVPVKCKSPNTRKNPKSDKRSIAAPLK